MKNAGSASYFLPARWGTVQAQCFPHSQRIFLQILVLLPSPLPPEQAMLSLCHPLPSMTYNASRGNVTWWTETWARFAGSARTFLVGRTFYNLSIYIWICWQLKRAKTSTQNRKLRFLNILNNLLFLSQRKLLKNVFKLYWWTHMHIRESYLTSSL